MNPPSPVSSPNPFAARPGALDTAERGLFWIFRIATYTVLLCGALIFADIIFKGSSTVFGSFRATSSFPYFTNTFLAESPETLHVFELDGKKQQMGDREFREFGKRREAEALAAGQTAPAPVRSESYAHSAGGIWPCIVGTVLLTIGSMTIALVLGVCSAIYLSEYARDGRFVRFIRLAIINLAGVPSIVFGLFGFGLFVIFFGWNVSLLAGWFTLAFMVLPVVITASEEALKAVPRGFREGALALGATKWQAIRTNVLPYAMPGILTSSILGIARVAGETAPIMFTAAYVVRDKLPWEVDRIGDFFFQSVMALPYHIYVVSSKIPQNEYTERVQYGTAFVFLLLVGLIATSSILLRNKLRGRYQW
ncbi:phosphate ABC transporter permease [Opitutaceae bacterium TAV5]|nr:phosphate ABC transporter permease [Opitutaceae bacterium TAV5]